MGERYQLLEHMIQSAEQKDHDKVMELNMSFEEIFRRSNYDSIYDNCRQSCVMAVTWDGMYEKFLADARAIFSRLPANE